MAFQYFNIERYWRLFQKTVVCTKFWYLRFIYKKQISMEVDEMLISLENRYLLVYYSDKYVQSLRNTDKEFKTTKVYTCVIIFNNVRFIFHIKVFIHLQIWNIQNYCNRGSIGQLFSSKHAMAINITNVVCYTIIIFVTKFPFRK